MPLILLGQRNIEGKYCSLPGYAGFCIVFDGNGRFDYNYSSCLSVNDGKGKYVIENDSLFLFFDDVDNKAHGFEITKTTPSDKSFITIEILTRQGDKNILPFYKIKASKEKPSKNTEYFDVINTDRQGKATLSMPSSSDTVWISAHEIFFPKPVYIPIVPNMNYQMLVGMNEKFVDLIFNEVYKFKIAEMNKRKLILVENINGEDYIRKLKRSKK